MASKLSSPNTPCVPDFIRFLFSSKPKFDCHFLVGNESHGKPERIGAVKLMLMAHSEVFRLSLEDSELKDKGNVPIKDVHPNTFKGLLKFVYGHDVTPEMGFDEADDLLYAAEKYLMKTLKDKLALRLMTLLNRDNICSLINNPACFTHLQLNSAITDILRYETDRVLASPQFMCVDVGGFQKILEQDGLAVSEIELWRAAVQWAKNKANSEDGQLVRQQLSGLTQHLRLCTLTGDEMLNEVSGCDVLSDQEVGAVCRSISRKENPQHLREISNEIVPRKRLNAAMKPVRDLASGSVRKLTCELRLEKLTESRFFTNDVNYRFTIQTKTNVIELLPLVCHKYDSSAVEWTTTITKVVNSDSSISAFASEPIVLCSEHVEGGAEFRIPLAVGGRDISLQPDTEYRVEMRLRGRHRQCLQYFSEDSGSGSYSNHHLTLDIPCNDGWYDFPSDKLQYRVVT